MNERKVSEL